MLDFLSDIPVVGDIYDAARGNPDQIKAAYDAQIKASQQQSKQMRDFLMAQKGQAQSFYGPIQHMFQQAYGSEGLMAPQIPGGTPGMSPLPGQTPQGPLAQMYAPQPKAPSLGGGGRRY